MWDLDLICELAAAGLERRARELDAEGSVRGIDCLKELEIHAILREALAAELPGGGRGGRFGVLAEQRYPGDRLKPRRSEGERCDIVLLPPGNSPDSPGGTSGLPRRGSSPDDTPAAEPRADKPPVPPTPSDPESPWHRRLLDPLEAGTLFAGLGVPPEDALWIEVKVAGQFALIDGIGRANPGYSSVLLREVPADARKLAADAVIRDAAVLVVVFNVDEATATHDLDAWRVRCIEKGWPLEAPFVRGFGIGDRIGNGVVNVMACAVRS